MTLLSRVSAFFLAALAIVLAACVFTFYGVMGYQLRRHFDQEFYGVLQSLVAAIEVEPDEVKWQPTEHTIGLGLGSGPAETSWVILGDGAAVVETSPAATAEFVAQAVEISEGAAGRITEARSAAMPGWRFLRQRLAASAPDPTGRELDEFDQIVVVVARSTARLNADLTELAWLAGLLPAAGWLLAAAVGRWYCRRALRPVAEMAREASSMTAANFQVRLPESPNNDELTELGRAFNELLDRLQRAYDLQRRFTGDAAHELRTPLTALLGHAEVALRKPRNAQEYRDALAVVRQQASELQQTLESLLLAARADGQAAAPEMVDIELSRWLEDYLARWQDHPRAADIRLACAEPVVVHTSPTLLIRVLDNLLGNAAKYAAAGTPIGVELSRQAGGATISVSDEGPGIAAEDLELVFAPFFRTQGARNSGAAGAGLGLAIARRFAEALGATLGCESAPGCGARFVLQFPASVCRRPEDKGEFTSASPRS